MTQQQEQLQGASTLHWTPEKATYAASGRAHPKQEVSPKAEFHRKPVSVHSVAGGCGPQEKKWPQSSSLASEFPREPDLEKKIDPYDLKGQKS